MNSEESINLTCSIVTLFLVFTGILIYVFFMMSLPKILFVFDCKFYLIAFFVILSSDSPGNWKDQTHMVSKDGQECVVRALKNDAVLFRHKDPQRCVEWGMSNGVNTIVLEGEYIFDDRIDEMSVEELEELELLDSFLFLSSSTVSSISFSSTRLSRSSSSLSCKH